MRRPDPKSSRPSFDLRAGPHPSTPDEALAQLHATCFVDRGTPWSAHSFQSLRADTTIRWVEAFAVEDGDVETALIAFAAHRLVLQEAELLTLCRDPDLAGFGLGAEVLAKVVEVAIAGGANTMFLEVSEGNHSARRLYQKLGFHDVGRRPRYYRGANGVWQDALVMRTEFKTA